MRACNKIKRKNEFSANDFIFSAMYAVESIDSFSLPIFSPLVGLVPPGMSTTILKTETRLYEEKIEHQWRTNIIN